MNIIYKFILWLDSYVDKPAMFGVYHLICLLILIISCTTFILLSRNKTDKYFKRTLFICWILLVVFEIIKEIMVGFSVDSNNVAHYQYNFIYFPYQLCSLPFYVLPLIIFIKNEKIKEFFVSSTVSYILLGGIVLTIIPGGFKNSLYLNFHTMFHHCTQIFSSIVCICWYKNKMSFKNFFKCIPPFTFFMALSILFNSVLYKLTSVNLQLWNLSPYVVMDIDILENIRQSIGYIPYVIVYYNLILLLSLGVYMIPVLINKIHKGEKYEKNN